MADRKKLSTSRSMGCTRRHMAVDAATLEMYRSFMEGYVRRINQATFDVVFGGIRIGSARYTRLAQINLKTRIITFSRYAIENVPERGRRYLVIHELAHVLEPSHNALFWSLVGRFEPNFKQVRKQLDLAFKRNVREEALSSAGLLNFDARPGRAGLSRLLSSPVTLMERTEGIEPGFDELDCSDDFSDDFSDEGCHTETVTVGSPLPVGVVTTA